MNNTTDINICSAVCSTAGNTSCNTVKEHKVSIVDYTLGEELVSSISHGVGFFLAVAALVLCVVRSARHGDAWAVVSSSIFGATLCNLYLNSTIYHALKPNTAKRVFRVLDHCSVFLLIAGTYTPYTLVTLRGVWGWTLFGVIWGIAILGIIFNAIDVDKYQKVSAFLNIAMGWAVVVAFKPMLDALPIGAIVYLVAGGLAYSLGAILYAKGDNVRYMHSIWHFFVLAGSILHFFSIFLYVL